MMGVSEVASDADAQRPQDWTDLPHLRLLKLSAVLTWRNNLGSTNCSISEYG